jgi:hypothetical protein
MAGVVTHYAYDLTSGTLIAELPLTSVRWNQRLNQAGSFSGQINFRDARMPLVDVINSTRPARTLLVVDIDGTPSWSGIIWTRQYAQSQGIVQIGAQEIWSYYAQRLQHTDYTNPPASGTYWSGAAGSAADACYIAAQILSDAGKVAGTAFNSSVFPMGINIIETSTNVSPVVVSYPITQLQTISQMISTLSGGAYNTGFDFYISIVWQNSLPGGVPVFTMNFYFPRIGRIAGQTGLVVDSQQVLDYTWAEDGTQMANSIYLNATISGQNQTQIQAQDPVVLSAGYPLLEKTTSATNVQTTSLAQTVAQGDLAQFEWPIATPQFTVPMFQGDLTVNDFIMGDDIRVLMQPDERFLTGFDTYMRIVGADYALADSGVSTMTMTLNMPPALAPTPAPPL